MTKRKKFANSRGERKAGKKKYETKPSCKDEVGKIQGGEREGASI